VIFLFQYRVVLYLLTLCLFHSQIAIFELWFLYVLCCHVGVSWSEAAVAGSGLPRHKYMYKVQGNNQIYNLDKLSFAAAGLKQTECDEVHQQGAQWDKERL
jgi:hypothetical protein